MILVRAKEKGETAEKEKRSLSSGFSQGKGGSANREGQLKPTQ